MQETYLEVRGVKGWCVFETHLLKKTCAWGQCNLPVGTSDSAEPRELQSHAEPQGVPNLRK